MLMEPHSILKVGTFANISKIKFYFDFTTYLGHNHIHLTVRLGFVTQHLWIGDFGKCSCTNSSVTLPEVIGYVSLQLIS